MQISRQTPNNKKTLIIAFFLALIFLLVVWFTFSDKEKGYGEKNILASLRNRFGSGMDANKVSSSTLSKSSKKSNRSEKQPEAHYGPNYQLYESDGLLNKNILDQAQVPDEKRSDLQSSIENIWSEISKNMEGRATLIKGPDKTNHSLGTYFIKGDPAIAEEFRLKLKNKISDVAGHRSADKILPYLDQSGNLAGLGRYDMKIEFTNPPRGADPVIYSIFTITDPSSDRTVAGGFFSDPIKRWVLIGSAFENITDPK